MLCFAIEMNFCCHMELEIGITENPFSLWNFCCLLLKLEIFLVPFFSLELILSILCEFLLRLFVIIHHVNSVRPFILSI